jgi:uncharacterized protein
MSIQVVLSPSKLLNEQAIGPVNCQLSQPRFLNECKRLAKELLKYDVGDWQKKLAVKQEVAQRSIDWTTQIVKSNFKNIRIPAACLFQGEAYKFLEASSFSKKEWKYASENLFILSGMYGLLHASDVVLPYRLMMGTSVSVLESKSLYAYWNERVNSFFKSQPQTKFILNCASEEYSKILDRKILANKIVDVDFLQKKEGELKQIATISKQSRGAMARFVVQNELTDVKSLQAFNAMGYNYHKALSTANKLVFVR